MRVRMAASGESGVERLAGRGMALSAYLRGDTVAPADVESNTQGPVPQVRCAMGAPVKQVLFLIHGMGNSANAGLGEADPALWGVDVKERLLEDLKRFRNVDSASVQIIPILYDDVFRSHVTRWSDLADSLVGTPLASLTDWMKGTDGQDFLWGSLGDVVLYRAFAEVREHVLTHVARQMIGYVNTLGRTDYEYSVLAHSLGTAVAHDAIHKLATVGIDGNTSLQPPNFRFKNFFALANVTRLVWLTDGDFYRDTRVRPPKCGLPSDACAVEHYTTFRHIADPVPSIVRFKRKDWDRSHFWSLELAHYRELNVHAFTHYLAHPAVTNLLFLRLFGPDLVPAPAMKERLDVFKPYAGGVEGAAQETAVQTMAAILDKLSASSHGSFATDFDEVGKAMLIAKEKHLV
jgi:hypothetical protein